MEKIQNLKMTEVNSSQINSIGYSEENKILAIEFKGGAIYYYSSVPKEVYEEMLKSESPGKFLHSNIKNVYQYQKMT